ncbi:MAG: hypothetical protein ACREQ9_04055, partial [Candidatus Binatia bacterium]
MKRSLPPPIAAAVFLASAGAASALPIRTADPNVGVFSGYAALGRVEVIEASNSQMDVSATAVAAGILYSPTTYTAFGVVVPYVEKRVKLRGQGEELTRGLSDVQLLARYKFFSRPALRAWNQASFQLTLKAPTGSTERGTRLDLPPVMKRAVQPGTGSTDFVFDVTGGRFTSRYNGILDVGYRLNTESDGVAFGDQFFANADLEWFLLPRLTRKRGQEILALLELGWVHGERDELDGRDVRDSGGDRLLVAPGIQWIVSERFLVEASV